MSESTDELIEDEDALESASPAEAPPSAVEVDEQTPDGGQARGARRGCAQRKSGESDQGSSRGGS